MPVVGLDHLVTTAPPTAGPGVDKVTAVIPANSLHNRPRRWGPVTYTAGRTKWVFNPRTVDDAAVSLTAYPSPAENRRARYWVHLTLNPSRLHDPFGHELCPLDLAQGWVLKATRWAAEQLVQPARGWRPEVSRLHRVDLACDFPDVPGFGNLASALANAPRDARIGVQTYRFEDGRRPLLPEPRRDLEGVDGSLYLARPSNGKSSLIGKVYDLGSCHGVGEQAGARVEFEISKRTLETRGIRTLGDLTQENAEQALYYAWSYLGIDSLIVHPDYLQDVLVTCDLVGRPRQRLEENLSAAGRGEERPHDHSRDRAALKALGVAVASHASSSAPPYRLDPSSGAVVPWDRRSNTYESTLQSTPTQSSRPSSPPPPSSPDTEKATPTSGSTTAAKSKKKPVTTTAQGHTNGKRGPKRKNLCKKKEHDLADPENVYVHPGGKGRECKSCRNEKKREYRQRQKAAKAAEAESHTPEAS